jgi:hypothetical protein
MVNGEEPYCAYCNAMCANFLAEFDLPETFFLSFNSSYT